jgi:hypothetical protein
VSDIREEYRLRAFENMVLSRIFGMKRDDVTVGGVVKETSYRGIARFVFFAKYK